MKEASESLGRQDKNKNRIHLFKTFLRPGVMTHTFNPGIRGREQSPGLAWSRNGVPSQPRLHSETISNNQMKTFLNQ